MRRCGCGWGLEAYLNAGAGQCEVRLARLPSTIGRWEAAAGRWALGLRIPAPGPGSEDDASPFGLIQPSLGFPLARPV